MDAVYSKKTLTVIDAGAACAVVVLIATLFFMGRPSLNIADGNLRPAGASQQAVMHALTSDITFSAGKELNSRSVQYRSRTYSNPLPFGSLPIATILIPNFIDDSKDPAQRRALNEAGELSAAPIVVSYYRHGSSVYRVEIDPDLPSKDPRNAPRLIATPVGDVELSQILSQTEMLIASSEPGPGLRRALSSEATPGTAVLRFTTLKSL